MATDPRTSVRFESPPVVETILGVQFPPLPFTSGHLGWFWKGYLGEGWPKAMDAPSLHDQFERFGDQVVWGVPGLQFALVPPSAARLQLTNSAEDRVVQVQGTRFIYNWRKQQKAYPSYDQSRAEFDELYACFCRFVADAGLGAVSPNQWEVSYIDHIPKGTLWHSPADWYRILPAILPPSQRLKGLKFENAGEWHYEIEPQRGRLHVTVQHGRATSPTGPEVLVVQWTARGPITDRTSDLGTGLDLGHQAIVRAFLEMTSPEAHKAWGRRG